MRSDFSLNKTKTNCNIEILQYPYYFVMENGNCPDLSTTRLSALTSLGARCFAKVYLNRIYILVLVVTCTFAFVLRQP